MLSIQTSPEVVVDLTSFLRYNIATLFKFLRKKYPKSNITAYLNITKPEVKSSERKKKIITELCNKYKINLITSIRPDFVIINKASHYKFNLIALNKRNINHLIIGNTQNLLSQNSPAETNRFFFVLVSNSIYLIKTLAKIFNPGEIEFIILSSFYHALEKTQTSKDIRKLLEKHHFTPFFGLLYSIEKSIRKVSDNNKILKQAKGFSIRKKLNDRLLQMLPTSTNNLLTELKKTYKDQALVALCGFLYHNPVAFKNKQIYLLTIEDYSKNATIRSSNTGLYKSRII